MPASVIICSVLCKSLVTKPWPHMRLDGRLRWKIAVKHRCGSDNPFKSWERWATVHPKIGTWVPVQLAPLIIDECVWYFYSVRVKSKLWAVSYNISGLCWLLPGFLYLWLYSVAQHRLGTRIWSNTCDMAIIWCTVVTCTLDHT